MSVVIKKKVQGPRWTRTLRSRETFSEDLGVIGAWVGPRTGPDPRTHGQKEDYVLRRLLVAWKESDLLRVPLDIEATDQNAPDFVLRYGDGEALGVEVTEAGEEQYQAWLTKTESARETGRPVTEDMLKASTERTVNAIRKAIADKIEKYDRGGYRDPEACDLLVYENTAWGGFLHNDDVLDRLGRPQEFLGRFREVHLVFGEIVFLDIFNPGTRRVDISRTYDIDYAAWVFDQVERIRKGARDTLDLNHIAEELEQLGRAERRALASHVRNLLAHLLKWQVQPERRTPSWRLTIVNSRSEIFDLLDENPSLRSALEAVVQKQFRRACEIAAVETGLTAETFPETCPYDEKTLFDPEFMPGDDEE